MLTDQEVCGFCRANTAHPSADGQPDNRGFAPAYSNKQRLVFPGIHRRTAGEVFFVPRHYREFVTARDGPNQRIIAGNISESAWRNAFSVGGFKREAVGCQSVQMAGQILFGVLDLPGVRRRASGGRFNLPAVALLFDQVAGPVHHPAHRKAVLVCNSDRRHMGKLPCKPV
jgi:hypothetical protein